VGVRGQSEAQRGERGEQQRQRKFAAAKWPRNCNTALA
jgi:hypothetical protein